jgi:hypothetical protein
MSDHSFEERADEQGLTSRDYEALSREAEMGYTQESGKWVSIEKKLLATTDAFVWAETFKDQFGDVAPDRYTMLTWFANAIETGRNAGLATARQVAAEAIKELNGR